MKEKRHAPKRECEFVLSHAASYWMIPIGQNTRELFNLNLHNTRIYYNQILRSIHSFPFLYLSFFPNQKVLLLNC
jgi:hypothetical protein